MAKKRARKAADESPTAGFSPRAVRLWDAIRAEFEIEEPHHIELLTAACRQLSRAEEAREQIEANGLLIADRFGQLRENPAIRMERAAHQLFLRLMRELGLDLETVTAVTRGPGRRGT